MARRSPLRHLHEAAHANMLAYAPSSQTEEGVELVSTFGEIELEYAAIRRSVAVLDAPHRTVIEVKGKDRIGFLNNMLTQELKDIRPGVWRRSFWLNTKGRIEADLRVLCLEDRILLDVDVHAATRTLESLRGYVIMDDASLTLRQNEFHRLSVHGPMSAATLDRVRDPAADHSSSAEALIHQLVDGQSAEIRIGGHAVIVARDDQTGDPGYELFIPTEGTLHVYSTLIAAGQDANDPESPMAGGVPVRAKVRPLGWHAFNIARIEAGTPLYNIDFGPESLPAETSLLDSRVSFKKGCYLGQEIVARMHARGHPKQKLVAIKFESVLEANQEFASQPISGAPLSVLPDGDPIGAITSSTFCPMLSGAPGAMAQVKWAHIAPGTVVFCPAEGQMIKGVIQPTLALWGGAAAGVRD